jgi:carboxyl-terminal processing protease
VRWCPAKAVVFCSITTFVAALSGCGSDVGTIGALLGQKPDGRLFVRDTPGGLAAARQGLEPGDEILLVDGKDVRQMSDHELYRSLSGDVGTTVRVTVARGEAVIRVTLVRTAVPRKANPAAH